MEIHQNVIKILREINSNGKIDIEKLEQLSIEEQELVNNLYQEGLVEEALCLVDSMDVDRNWEELQDILQRYSKPVVPLWKKLLKYAAVLIVLLGCFFLFQQNRTLNPDVKLANDEIKLVLENGEVQILKVGGNDQVVLSNGQVVGNQKGKELNYVSASSVKELVYNTIQIPNGKIFNITLSDGTHVYLNSGSSLKFPVQFVKGMKREVFLEGEAFFDVTKDKAHPFVVNADDVRVKVLGTKFNVSSYAEDKTVNTVLVEGSVALGSSEKPADRTMLKPGFKGAFDKSGTAVFSLEKVDTKQYTNWMKGEIAFKGIGFKEIARKLERTYNVSITNNNKELDDVKFSGSFDRNIESINEVMDAMSKIYSFDYKITKTNSITITK
ncbi:FecR family protein [Flavobacterium fluvii]|uniref:FecR family protein n=1 Tax=Flavobacterium fluvii TaxID=468056 RepID=A0A1M5NIK8_9FLAO|nr:FecR domain-containing protein [Flavobacterium fluvii]SHG89297.1 FecR family protein [Flavobacterium fluvii]